jgi:hypothetical protein
VRRMGPGELVPTHSCAVKAGASAVKVAAGRGEGC